MVNLKRHNKRSAKQEEGMALAITLVMGLLLVVGASSLVARMVMGRKLGAAESYQQMAESAALNGFNRILATFNKDDGENYRGYYFALNNHQGDPEIKGDEQWHWETANTRPAPVPLQELCTNTSVGLASSWPREHVQLTSGSSQRNDGGEPIQLFYRLRGYASPGQSASGANGEGVFEIEGIVKREGASAADEYLARTLLTRSLYVQSIVAAEDDWGVMAGHHLELAGSSITDHNNSSNSSGLIMLDVNVASGYQDSWSCDHSQLASDVGAPGTNLGSKVWPTLNRGLPMTKLFEKDNAIDSINNTPRIWSFDDTDPAVAALEQSASANFHSQCSNGLVCAREEGSSSFSTPSGIDIDQDNNSITINSNAICAGQDGFECHLHIEHLKLSKTKLLIENNDRPVVIHMERPQSDQTDGELSGNIKLSGTGLLCGVNNGSTSCNQKPEKLVITSNTGGAGMNCAADSTVLSFEGDNLPHALVHLPKGTVRPTANAKVHGLIWAHSICANNGAIQLVSEDSSGTVVRAADELWQWSDQGFPGYGRMVTRGIRGTGLDTFRRW